VDRCAAGAPPGRADLHILENTSGTPAIARREAYAEDRDDGDARPDGRDDGDARPDGRDDGDARPDGRDDDDRDEVTPPARVAVRPPVLWLACGKRGAHRRMNAGAAARSHDDAK
jgi:hypothetical protein